ncbi:MAG: hypothetical protein DI538_26800 [Azospira oryzae]|nr:MAG: hypothetical protein DI538_26800 [Azospira oryzae]
MTDQQAQEILSFLVKELEDNGFGEIVRQIRIQFEEQYELDKRELELSSTNLLRFYLRVARESLAAISSERIPELILTINKQLSGENRMEEMEMELLDGRSISLKNLPNYRPIIEVISAVERETQNEDNG